MRTTINCNGKLLDIRTPKVMGILNITPDSFYDGGKYFSAIEIEKRIKQIFEQGASIIDIGAYSTRPGAKEIDSDEEWKRLTLVLELTRKSHPDVIISVDTFRSEIAKKAVENYNVAIINDISGGQFDNKMYETIADLGVAYIMMHIKGTPQTMQQNPQYKDLMQELFFYFAEKTENLKQLGVKDIIIDPGFGFGKTIEHNYKILNRLDEFKIFDFPVLAGLSRKSMIYKALNITSKQALAGTIALNTIALQKGVKILRVHDVKAAVDTVNVYMLAMTGGKIEI